MAKRQNIVTVDSSEVQGEGSYVVVRRRTVKEMRVLVSSDAFKKVRQAVLENEDVEDAGIDMSAIAARKQILEWNWVDDDGNALPLPKDDPETFELLTEVEFAFIADALGAQKAVEQKN